jgi:hypothetical protein
MPLTERGKRLKEKFKQRYGARGEEVFYRTEAAGKLKGVVKKPPKKKPKK